MDSRSLQPEVKGFLTHLCPKLPDCIAVGIDRHSSALL